MNKGLFIGACPICKQGMQEILCEKKSGNFFVECDECMVEWENPQDALENKDASRFKYGEARDATKDEAQALNWLKYVVSTTS
jgi:hypothetical protein